MKWTSRWPTKPRWYWLYGKRFSDDIIQLNPVEVVLTKTGPVYIIKRKFPLQDRRSYRFLGKDDIT